MSIQRWWEERLLARFPLGIEAVAVEGYNFKPQQGDKPDKWPRAVARYALYDDYRFWFEDACVKPIKETVPEAKWPKAKTELEFFVCIKPWLYYDKDHQVKNYWVFMSKMHNGAWVRVKVRRWFVRLGPFDDHVAMFLADTGVDMRPSVGTYRPT